MSSEQGRYSDGQVELFRETFQLFDKDKDGYISASELGNVLRKLGHSSTDKAIKIMVRQVDSDSDGNINFAEFLTLMARRIRAEQAKDEIKNAFAMFDTDKSGKISPKELHSFMISLGENVTLEECTEMVMDVDENNDGEIDIVELVQLMRKD